VESREIERLLDAGALKHPCDLDLLLFFRRHPDSLITSEQLARFVGHDLRQVGRSLDALVEHAFVLRSQNPTHWARQYRLAPIVDGEWLHRVLRVADTFNGRRELRRLLRDRASPPESPASPQNPGLVTEPEDTYA
jgi:hypothetical protein